MVVKFRVQHLSHTGSVISTHTPVGGTLRWGFRANDVGDIFYQLPLSDDAIQRDAFAPYFTDWRLQQSVEGGSWTSIAAGIHVPINIVSDEDAINVAGKDWAHWLEQPVWFNIYDIQFTQLLKHSIIDEDKLQGWEGKFDAFGFYDGLAVKVWIGVEKAIDEGVSGATQRQIIKNLLENLDRGVNSLDITPSFGGTGWTEILAYFINFQDETTVLQHINTIADLDTPYGFDWTMNFNKTMEFFGPRKTTAGSPDPIWVINENSILTQPIDTLDWTNNGPLGTHIVGLGPGNPAIWRIKKDQDSIERYRLWLRLARVGESYLKAIDDVRYATEGLQYIFPQKDLKITIRPEDIDPFTAFKNHIGDVIRVTWDFPEYHQVDAFFWITEQQFYSDAPGNFKCDLGLQQIYG